MANPDQQILKYLAKNPGSGPSIMELMKRLNLPIVELSSVLDSLFNRQLVTKQVDQNGVERWFPIGSTGFAPSPSAVVQPLHAMPEAVSASMPTTAFSQLTPQSQGISWPMFLLGLLLMGAAAAWVGGHYLARDSVKDAMRLKVDRQEFSDAMAANNLAGTRLSTLETKSKALASVLDSLKATQLEVKKLSLAVDSLKTSQAQASKGKKTRGR